MMTLANRYATALFEIAREKQIVHDFHKQTIQLISYLENDGANKILVHPRITAEQKLKFIRDAFANQFHTDIFGFLTLAINKNREIFIVPALKELIAMIMRFTNHTTARIVCAQMPTEMQQTKLKATLSKKLGKIVTLNIVIDPQIIGGLSIQVDEYFIDKTVRFKLKEMSQNLKGIAI